MRVNNWLSGFACVLLLGVVGCKKDKIREGIPVVVEKVGVDDVEIFGDYVGRIRARQFVEVHARVEGYLEKMLFEEGKRVERNQPLFIINPDLYKARADKAAAQLKKDEAQELKTGRDVERLRPLYEQNAASQLDLDNAIAAYESAKANVAMSKADLAQAEMELGYTTVRSPISGYISERHADIGTLVGPGSKSLLATVVASDTVLVDFSLTALDYLRSQQRNVRLGEQDATRSWQPSITVTLADNSVYPEKGRLCRASGRSQDRYFRGESRTGQSRAETAARTVYQSQIAARCARKRRSGTCPRNYYREGRCSCLCYAQG